MYKHAVIIFDSIRLCMIQKCSITVPVLIWQGQIPSCYDVVREVESSSFSYAYAEDDTPPIISCTNTSPEAHYEFDAASEDAYWEPSSQEDELRAQFKKIEIDNIPGETIQ